MEKKTHLIVTSETEEQKYEYEWRLEFADRGSRNYVMNFAFLLLEIRVNSLLTSTFFLKIAVSQNNRYRTELDILKVYYLNELFFLILNQQFIIWNIVIDYGNYIL